jgi:hypothetical protein
MPLKDANTDRSFVASLDKDNKEFTIAPKEKEAPAVREGEFLPVEKVKEEEEKISKDKEKVEEERPSLAQPAAAQPPAQAWEDRSSLSILRRQVEDILAEDLQPIYDQLSPALRKEFKIKGEETASRIAVLLTETKVKVKKILQLIRDWLKIIPGINKFFLEQESKIKTDRLLARAEQQRGQTIELE